MTSNISMTHLTVFDVPPPGGREVIGVFKTYVPVYAPNRAALLMTSDAEPEVDEVPEAEVETKVVRRGRRPKVTATEGAETK